ncbi:hypothetical protein BKA65DRAFT_554022 [Rhexocercosporidium sp. MPI-PUGE-AT-0058]|nr:hypothetical protein BKA65DRAFT_554022 [Rhexocercosporidium sp. MPI-PUGE-AT-0058]
MAPTETPAKPEQPESPQVNGKRETAQNSSTDPATTEHLQRAVGGTSDPAMEESLRTSSSWDDLPVTLFEPEPFVSERKE